MRNRSAMLADTIGPAVILLFMMGCVPQALVRGDLRPFVAAAGSYAILQAPAPTPAVCSNCGGKGVVGDGRIEVPCPVCRPQTSGTAPCPTGKCPLPTQRIAR